MDLVTERLGVTTELREVTRGERPLWKSRAWTTG